MTDSDIEVIRQKIPCPTCGGAGEVEADDPDGGPGQLDWYSCHDCTDGKISPERAWAIVSLVFAVEGYEASWRPATCWDDCIAHLRAVQP